ncbi:MAG: class I SAM-dependent methyltransferase [Candidatus Omnitrophica bacterium]|nr:class I SAM-dependent methyltransferase [Candidatus Omnitrophota bacterium]
MSHYAKEFERYRSVLDRYARFDLRAFDVPTHVAVLDVGCGFGDDLRRLAALGYANVRGIEPDPYCVSRRGELPITCAEITQTGYPDRSVDAVLAHNVFHHIEDYAPALQELHRILRPGGLLCFVEPRNSIWRRAMDALTFRTPLPEWIGGPLRSRYVVMSEEVRTGLYPKWLASHRRFFALLDRYFETVWLRREPFFFSCKLTARPVPASAGALHPSSRA